MTEIPVDQQLKMAREKAKEILENANAMAREIILDAKNNSVEELAKSIGDVNQISDKHKLLIDLSRLDFICNRIDNIDKGVTEIKENSIKVHSDTYERIGDINEKLDGYPLIKNAVITTISIVCVSFIGALTYLVFKNHGI